MAYNSSDGTFWTVNADPKQSGKFMPVLRRKGKNTTPTKHGKSTTPAEAGAKAAQLAYQHGLADGLKAAQDAINALGK